MIKEAKTKAKLNPLLIKRWSPRAFSDHPVEEKKLRNMFEAARWSASASNLQPWKFFVGLKGDNVYEKIMETLIEFNQKWAINAPVLIMSCGATLRDEEGNINGTWQYDLGQAMAYLSIQATNDGLYVHQMGGFDVLKAAELFQIPEDVIAVTVTAVGYLGDPGMLHPRMQKSEIAERERKEINTFVFAEHYGDLSPIAKS